jgi:hypothetical protein
MPLPRRTRRSRDRCVGRVSRQARSPAWQTWLAENLLLAVPRERLLATLAANGIGRRTAEREIDTALQSPILVGAQEVANRARRRALAARLERETSRLAPSAREIARRSGVSRDEFFERYYAAGVPIVLTDTLEHWPALSHWSPASFKQRLGGAAIEVTTGRDDDLATHTHFKEPSTISSMAELCDRVDAAGTTNSFYLIANEFGPTDALAPLVDDIAVGHPYIGDERDGQCMLLWFGPRGTVTPLHHDTKNVLLCQLFGRKRVIVFPRFELPLTGARPDSLYAPIDVRRAEPFPELAEALRWDVTLAAGEALFLPVGSFHQMHALDVSISLGFSNFRAPNRFDGYQPGRIR